MTHVIDSFLTGLPPHERRRIEALVDADPEELARRRQEGEPLQYLEGTAAFLDLDLVVDGRVLVPRPETEGLVELAASLRSRPEVIVDLGTGSGALAIALARRYPAADVHGTDISPDALEVACQNIEAHAPGVRLHRGDLFEALPVGLVGAVDLLVSNPPYVAAAEWPRLPADVRHEPRAALVAGERGTEVLERIAEGSGKWVRSGGYVVCEIGETQGVEVEAAFGRLGRTRVERDLAGKVRYATVEVG